VSITCEERAGAHGKEAGVCYPACSPQRQFDEHVVSVGVGKVGAELGQIWTEFGHGPKTKFAGHKLLYTFY
jgi:hypothetical protein